jgi:hypothetical protein
MIQDLVARLERSNSVSFLSRRQARSLPSVFALRDSGDCSFRQQVNNLKNTLALTRQENKTLKAQLTDKQAKFEELSSISKKLGIRSDIGLKYLAKIKEKLIS